MHKTRGAGNIRFVLLHENVIFNQNSIKPLKLSAVYGNLKKQYQKKEQVNVYNPASSRIILDTAHACDKGDMRPVNEDRVLVKKYVITNEEWGLFVVADGMDGKPRGHSGEVSQIVVDVLSDWWDNELATILSIPFQTSFVLNSLDKAIENANAKIAAIQTEKIIGSTMSLLLMMGQKYAIRHVGDSRIYLLNKSSGIQQITEDHTYVAQQVRAGLLTPEDARIHPKRNIITRCMGTKDMPGLFANEGDCALGDIFLLCSDGFYTLVSEKTMFDIASNPSLPIGEKVPSLRMCIEYGKAHDNISIILVCPKIQRGENADNE